MLTTRGTCGTCSTWHLGASKVPRPSVCVPWYSLLHSTYGSVHQVKLLLLCKSPRSPSFTHLDAPHAHATFLDSSLLPSVAVNNVCLTCLFSPPASYPLRVPRKHLVCSYVPSSHPSRLHTAPLSRPCFVARLLSPLADLLHSKVRARVQTRRRSKLQDPMRH